MVLRLAFLYNKLSFKNSCHYEYSTDIRQSPLNGCHASLIKTTNLARNGRDVNVNEFQFSGHVFYQSVGDATISGHQFYFSRYLYPN
ncbi:hypothetical protein GCM10008111_14770 [Alishewanella tabrizica]|uniref:Uncharacterized protein n=1 Tax=Alishewanella tabrizica TaxID=671278 RepID=A0ABQ2WN51_9ALTE|nr:hypothetical protein GCM10008111_14770 [Alishewanella tabrizica]